MHTETSIKLDRLHTLDRGIHSESEKLRTQFVTGKINDSEFHRKTDELIKEYVRRAALIIKSK